VITSSWELKQRCDAQGDAYQHSHLSIATLKGNIINSVQLLVKSRPFDFILFFLASGADIVSLPTNLRLNQLGPCNAD